MSLKSILGSNASWHMNKKVAHEIGLDATCLLQHLIDLDDYKYKGKPFFQQESHLLNVLPLNLNSLRNAKKILTDKGFITVVKKGMPAKNFFTINEKDILNLVIEEKSLCSRENTTTDDNSIPASVVEKTPPLVVEKTPPLVVEKTPPQNKKTTNKQNNKQISTYSETDLKLYKVFVEKVWPNWPEDRKGNMSQTIKTWNTLTVEERKLALQNATRYKKAQREFIHNINKYLSNGFFKEEYIATVEKRNASFTKINQQTESVANTNFDMNTNFLNQM